MSILLKIFRTVEGFFGEPGNIEDFVPKPKKKTGFGIFCGTHGRGQTFSTKYSNSQTSRLQCSTSLLQKNTGTTNTRHAFTLIEVVHSLCGYWR